MFVCAANVPFTGWKLSEALDTNELTKLEDNRRRQILTAAHTRTRLNDVGGNFVLPTATRCEPRGRCYLLSPLMGLRVEPEQV